MLIISEEDEAGEEIEVNYLKQARLLTIQKINVSLSFI
jgi:hypothetical protein